MSFTNDGGQTWEAASGPGGAFFDTHFLNKDFGWYSYYKKQEYPPDIWYKAGVYRDGGWSELTTTPCQYLSRDVFLLDSDHIWIQQERLTNYWD